MNSPADSYPAPLRAHLLGPVRLAVGEAPIADDAWRRRTARSVLLLLLSTPGHVLPRDRVLDLLWPDAAPDAALNALYLALSALRRTLEPGLRSGRDSAYIETAGETIRVRPAGGFWVDVDAFEAGLARAAVMPGEERAAALRQAIALYGGDLLADEPYADWAVSRREGLRQAWRHAILDLTELETTAGRALSAVPLVEQLLESDAGDEAALRALLGTLVASGQRDEALRRYERWVDRLRDDLGAEPSEETEAFVRDVRGAPVPLPRIAPVEGARFDNLPVPPNPLVGRARELEALQDLLWDAAVRVVTITGVGGTGKTRLALAIAHQVAEEFDDGVCYVSLGAIGDPALVLPTIARTLRIPEARERPPAELLSDHLRERQLLLVLDNFEQVDAAGPLVAEVLETCPRLKVLVTSRVPLHLRAEHVFPAFPLPVPLPRRDQYGAIRPDVASSYAAIALFCQRARAVRPDFALSTENAATVTSLCARLDGLPLAIELAAARMAWMTPDELLDRMADRFSVLAGGYRDLPERQRTMRDAIAWSYDLLDPDEQALFRRLAVFSGGWDLDLARRVYRAGGDPAIDVRSGLDRLVDKNLVRRVDADAGPRYDMLETIREFGADALRAGQEDRVVRRAHAAACLALAERAAPELKGPNQETWFERLGLDHDNIRAALAWSLEEGEIDVALRIGAAIWRFWWSLGYAGEGRQWLARALAGSDRAEARARAAGINAAGALAEAQGDLVASQELLEQAVSLWRNIGDTKDLANALDDLGETVRGRGDYERAIALHEEALAISRASGDRWGIARGLNGLGAVAYYRGDYGAVETYWEESLAIVASLGDARSEATLLNNLGALAVQRGDAEKAAARHGASLAARRRLGDKAGIASSLANLGGVAHMNGDLERARTLFEEAVAFCRELGDARYTAIALHNLGKTHRDMGHPTAAMPVFRECIALFRRIDDRFGVAAGLEGLGSALSDLGQHEAAARLYAAATALRAAIGAVREGVDQSSYERDLAAIQSALGEGFAAAWAAGLALSIDEAVADSLGEEPSAYCDDRVSG
jgi:predicted ATPase/DNA-binding SARP family transcriptional activator